MTALHSSEPFATTWRLAVPLRDYQETALKAFLARRHGSVVLPTGAGKTLVGIAAIVHLNLPTVVLVPTLVLLAQWERELGRTGIRSAVWSGERKEGVSQAIHIVPEAIHKEGSIIPEAISNVPAIIPNVMVVPHSVPVVLVSTYQSLFMAPERVRSFPFVIFDEGDMATAAEWSALLRESAHHPWALLLAATVPNDADRRHLLNQTLPVVYNNSPAEMIARRVFVRPSVVPYPLLLDPDEEKNYARAESAFAAASAILGSKDLREIAELARERMSARGDAARRYFAAFQARRGVLMRARRKPEAVLRIVRARPQERILLFSETIGSIRCVRDHLARYGIGCRIITGTTPRNERVQALREWGTGFFVLGSVRVLERGFDVPEVAVAVIIGSGGGATQLTHRIGRVVRPAPGKARATIYVVVAARTVEERLPDAMRAVLAR